MDDDTGDDLGLARAADAFGAARHELLTRRLQHLGDTPVGRDDVLVPTAVDDDREGMVAMITRRVDDLRRESLDMWCGPASSRTRLLDG